MPTFKWRGRTGDGRQIEGEINAHSKDEVSVRLRAMQIAVISIDEGTSSGDPAEAAAYTPPAAVEASSSHSESLSEELARGRAQKPRPLRGLVAIAALMILAIAIGWMSPIVLLRCERMHGQVTCTIDDRILGVVPFRHQTLSDVTSIDTESQSWRERGSTGSGIERRKSRIVLHGDDGNTIRPFGWDQGGTLGATTNAIEHDIDQFLGDPSQTKISRWQGQWVPLLMPAILILLALMMLMLVLVSLNANLTNRFYDQIDKLARRTDQRRQRHHP